MRDARYNCLFEPVKIGPVTAKNRFYQVPHCTGLGHVYPRGEAAMRGIKAEGGWAVVATQEVEIHPSSDVSPYIEGRLWDEGDMRRLALTADAIHEHDALAAIEITHNGHAARNAYSRLPGMAVSEMIIDNHTPAQTYAMTRKDIADVRRWHRRAAIRARDIGFDIVYCYAGHDLALPFHFISRNRNTRSDEYGGSLENRVRFLREIIEDTKEAVGDQCGIAVRFAVDELLGSSGVTAGNEGREVIEMLAELPDLWDINISEWSNDSQTSRFAAEGFQEPYTSFVKSLTSKPVVGVGRFTSPDTMVSQIRRGILDMIGAARPSIADPFLPGKIAEGRIEDIRECIGCNICVAGDMTIEPVRCTQNPTMAEEYRRNWHPEIIAPARNDHALLIVGAGPTGLEAALSLGRRGHRVVVADAAPQAGGRALLESRLPGLAQWRRVADYRLGQIEKLANVDLHLHSALNAQQVLEFSRDLNIRSILCACGASWDKTGIGREHSHPINRDDSFRILTPDDIMAGESPTGHTVIYDDDHYYMGSLMAQAALRTAADVHLVTPAADVASWTHNTLEQKRIEVLLHESGIGIIEKHRIKSIHNRIVALEHVAGGQPGSLAADTIILVTARRPRDQIFHAVSDLLAEHENSALTIDRAGDCLAPSTIAAAVYAGHLYARSYGEKIDPDQVPFKREYTEI